MLTIKSVSSNLDTNNNEAPNKRYHTSQWLKVFVLISIVRSAQSSLYHATLDYRRPVWNIAHMVNSIKEVDYRLSKGANALEADVTFDINGTPLTTFHGPPCDCMRHCNQQENLSDYLKHIRKLIDPAEEKFYASNLTLLFLDLKLDRLTHPAKVNAGIQLARSITSHLYNDRIISNTLDGNHAQPIYLVISINHVNDVDLVLNFVHYMNENNLDAYMKYIGWDVGMNDDIDMIGNTWKRFGKTLNLWQGDGFTNCISWFYNLNRLTTALTIRDSSKGYMSKVYQWTVDIHDRMRDALRLNVDGIMTNHPERLVAIMEEQEFNGRFRLASKDDNPFERINSAYSRRFGDAARFATTSTQAIPVVSGGFMAFLGDIITSCAIYVREMPFLGMPAATRLIIKRRREKTYDLKDTVITSSTTTTTSMPTMLPESHTNLYVSRLADREDPAHSGDTSNSISSPASNCNSDSVIFSLLKSMLLYLVSPNDEQIARKPDPLRSDYSLKIEARDLSMPNAIVAK